MLHYNRVHLGIYRSNKKSIDDSNSLLQNPYLLSENTSISKRTTTGSVKVKAIKQKITTNTAKTTTVHTEKANEWISDMLYKNINIQQYKCYSKCIHKIKTNYYIEKHMH